MCYYVYRIRLAKLSLPLCKTKRPNIGSHVIAGDRAGVKMDSLESKEKTLEVPECVVLRKILVLHWVVP